MDKMTLDEKINRVMVDLASVKTDVSWLKKLFVVGIIGIGTVFGIDLTGIVV